MARSTEHRYFLRMCIVRKPIILFSLACFLYVATYNVETIALQRLTGVEPVITAPRPASPSDCRCVDRATGVRHNFCYSAWAEKHSAAVQGDSTQKGTGDSTKTIPRSSTQMGPGANTSGTATTEKAMPNDVGLRFDCRWLETVKRLGLLDEDGFVDLTSDDPLPPPVFVTGVSDGHYEEELRLLSVVQKMFPQQKVIVYDLGLSAAFQDDVRHFCNVEYRKFPFSIYPDYVRNLNQYRWKPLIIAASLKEFKAIWWMDSSVHWKKADLSHIYSLLTCQPNMTAGMRSVERLHRKTGLSGRNLSSAWDKKQWRESMRRCDKFPYMLHSNTGHGIYSATHNGVYNYLPTDIDHLKGRTAVMFEAGFVFAVRTREVVQSVLKWYVLCALERDCMAPAGSKLSCRFQKDRFAYHAGCHRYDQSVVNVLLANANAYDSYYWTSGIDDFFAVVRGVKPEHRLTPLKCSKGNTTGKA